MQSDNSVHILWDASHIWGLMAWRALRALGVPSRLVKAQEIAQGALHGKLNRARLLLVPGGSAGRKALLLGKAGREAVCDFVRSGGSYLGFCGGAGLALSHERQEQGLGLSPWKRAPYSLRFQHLISGHVLAKGCDDATAFTAPPALSLPVWWPGRFAPQNKNANLNILAESIAPDADLWLADLPLAGVSPHVLETWRHCYGVNLSPDFLARQPLVITGNFGQGRYLLSYSHLETPESPAANAWLARILAGFGIAVPFQRSLPPWNLETVTKESSIPPQTPTELSAAMRHAHRRIKSLIDLGVEQRLFFQRTSWLWGWRAGIPGMVLNNLLSAFAELEELLSRKPADTRRFESLRTLERLWQGNGPRFANLLDLFCDGAESWLMASRLAAMLEPTMPDAVEPRGLAQQREALFGHAMQGGGIAEELLLLAEECLYLAQDLTD